MKRKIEALILLVVGMTIPAMCRAQNAYIANSSNLSVINTTTNKVVGTINFGDTGGVVVSPVGGAIYIETNNGVIKIDPATNADLGSLDLNPAPDAMALSPNGSTLYVLGSDGSAFSGTVSAVDTANMSLISTVTEKVLPFPSGITISPNGSTLYAAFRGPQFFNNVVAIDPSTLAIIADLSEPVLEPSGIAISPDGSKAYIIGIPEAANGGVVAVIDTATNTLITTIPIVAGNSFGYFDVDVSPDGGKLFAATDTALSVINTGTNSVIATIPLPTNFEAGGMAANPEGSRVYLINFTDNDVAVIDTATYMMRRLIPVGDEPDGRQFIIQPSFAGAPRDPTCPSQTREALASQFGSLNAAVEGLGFYNAAGLRRSIRQFCGGSGLVADEEGR